MSSQKELSVIFVVYGVMQFGIIGLGIIQGCLNIDTLSMFNIYILKGIELCCLFCFEIFCQKRIKRLSEKTNGKGLIQMWSYLVCVLPILILIIKLTISFINPENEILVINIVSNIEDISKILILCVALEAVDKFLGEKNLKLVSTLIVVVAIFLKYINFFYLKMYIGFEVFLIISNVAGYIFLGKYLSKYRRTI